MKVTQSLLGLGILTLFSACGNPKVHNSKVDGHFENATSEQMAVFQDTQAAVAEYKPTKQVMLSLPILTNYGREDLVAEILTSEVDEVIISVPQSFTGNLNSPVFAELKALAGANFSKVKLLKMNKAGIVTVWARDWAPLGAVDQTGDLALLDFNYYPNRPADDISSQSMGNMYNLPRVSIPVYNEGGNFMNNESGHCMMTTRVTDANKTRYVAGDMILNADQIKEYYKTYAGCKNVTIFPRMPNEGTGHIDMWAKFLDDNTLVVNELRQSTIDTITNTTQKNVALAIQKFLEDRASEITNMGYNVIRIPMPVPEVIGNSTVIRSYSNSLTVNGKAILTRYEKLVARGFAQSYTDSALTASYEAEVVKAYQDAGYRTAFINSDQLIATGGAVHCVTMQFADTTRL